VVPGDDRTEGDVVSDELIHVVTGLDEAEYEFRLRAYGAVAGADEPRMHRHPLFGLWHAHGPTVEAARTPHTHRPVVSWDTTPVPLDEVQP
jgi:hypothetical protein